MARLGVKPPEGAARHCEAARAELPVDLGHRAEVDGDSRLGAQGQRGEILRLDLLQETLAAARDFIAHPLTWIIGLPVLLVGFMFTVLRGRGK